MPKIRGLSDLFGSFKQAFPTMAKVESDPDITEFSSPGESGVNDGSDGSDGADGHADGEQSASWADEEETAMPDTLLHLINNGVRFKFAKPWRETARPYLAKSLSIFRWTRS